MTQARDHRRSWRNLLINKRYQLRFTVFMAGVAAVLMAGLGWWVVRVADDATVVAKSRTRGTLCPPAPERAEGPGTTTSSAGSGSAVANGSAASDSSAATGSSTGGGRPPRAIALDRSSMTLTEASGRALPAGDPRRQRAVHDACEAGIARQLAVIDARRRTIVVVMAIAGVVLLLGVIGFGIKMTHRVAGPLYKITLYLHQLRDGHYRPIYDLRKGDDLIEFYDHFRRGHAGVLALERADIDRIRAALEAVTSDGVLERSPEARAAAAELQAVLDRKEAAFVR